jgi:hypothetical protein
MNVTRLALLAVSTVAGVVAAPVSHAAFYSFTTTIHTVGTSDPALWGEFNYLFLDTATSAGSCPTDPTTGKVYIMLPTEKAYSTALAAQLAGRQVIVSLDDTHKDSRGNCVMRWMQVVQ